MILLQKLTSLINVPTKWAMWYKTDESMENSGTAMAVSAVPRAAPLLSEKTFKYITCKIQDSWCLCRKFLLN